MTQFNSQEQTIYHSLAWQIQLGFFNDDEHFPTVQEVANRFHVSYCPAQRALKALEKDGLIKLRKGKKTIVVAKPYKDYLKSDKFQQKVCALIDLCKTLKLFSSAICFQGLVHMDNPVDLPQFPCDDELTAWTKCLYLLFRKSIQGLGSQTAASLYYDIGAFAGNAFQDIMREIYSEKAGQVMKSLTQAFMQCLADCQNRRYLESKTGLERIERRFFNELEKYLQSLEPASRICHKEFIWEPMKGRTRYCDVIAIDLICKINQGIYALNSKFPNRSVLADTYHVSEITIRRTMELLNRIGIAKTINGVGTRVACTGDVSVLNSLKALKIDSNLKTFLEALQLFAITSQVVIEYTFPHIPADTLDAISNALRIKEQKSSLVATLSACLQSIIHYCPLSTIREIYGKITLLLLNGSILRIAETGREIVPEWTDTVKQLLDSLHKKDGPRFASVFQKYVADKHFNITKQVLLENGFAEMDKVSGLINV